MQVGMGEGGGICPEGGGGEGGGGEGGGDGGPCAPDGRFSEVARQVLGSVSAGVSAGSRKKCLGRLSEGSRKSLCTGPAVAPPTPFARSAFHSPNRAPWKRVA